MCCEFRDWLGHGAMVVSLDHPEPRHVHLSPHSLVHVGMRRHVRALDGGSGGFCYSQPTRLSETKLAGSSTVSADYDVDWMRYGTLRIRSNSRQSARRWS